MKARRAKLVPWSYVVLLFVVFSVFVSAVLYFSWIRFQRNEQGQVSNLLLQSATDLKNIARQRYDTIRLFQRQDQASAQKRLESDVRIYADVARQAELLALKGDMTYRAAQLLFMQSLHVPSEDSSAYCFVIDTDGKVVDHPILPVKFDLSQYRFGSQMLLKPSGTVQYNWKNPGELERVDRMASFQRLDFWNWVVCRAYILPDILDSEFEMIQLRAFYDFIKAYRSHYRSYAMILTEDGKIVAHPMILPGAEDDFPGSRVISEQGAGVSRFKDHSGRWWLAGTVRFEPMKWLISVVGEEKEIFSQVFRFRNRLLLAGFLGCLFYFWLLIYVLKRMAMTVRQRCRKQDKTDEESLPETR